MKELKVIQSGAVSKETADLILASVSSSTVTAYRRAIERIEIWLDGQVLTDALLAAYITELFHEGQSPSTISQQVSAVSWRAKGAGISSVVDEITRSTLAGIRRTGVNRGRGSVQGVSWGEVDSMIACCESDYSLKGLRDASLIRLMSDCLLRVSESVAINCEDFHRRTLTITKSKTDQEGEGASLYVCDATFDLISRYRESGNIESGALFRRMVKNDKLSKYRLTDRSARQIVKDRAHGAGIEGFVSGHSLRVGAAESLAQGGASIVQMQTAGRWKDPKMPAHYARSEMAERGVVAQLRDHKKGESDGEL